MALTLDTRRKAFMLEARVRGATAVEAAEAFTSLGGSRENNGGGLLAPITEVGQEDGPRSMGDLARELQDSSSNSSVSKRRAPGAFAPRTEGETEVKKEGSSKRKSAAPQRHGAASSGASKSASKQARVAGSEELEKERALRMEAERVAQSLRADLERERSAFQRDRTEIAGKNRLLRSALESTLRDAAESEAREKRRALGTAAFELGRARSQSVLFGGGGDTNWESGDAERELRRRRNVLLARKDALERKKAEIESRSTSAIETVSDVAAVQAQEACLARDQKELASEASALERRKMTHIREWTRAKSEDMSQWKGRPLQNDRYLLLTLLGKGGFSEVWLAFDLDTASKVAVKFHSLDRNWRDDRKREYVKRVAREYSIMRDLDHPRVVKLFDVFEINDDTFATVLEYCSGEDLDAVLRSRKTLPEPDARAVVLQVLAGLQHLHSPFGAGPDRRAAIIHYDLKPGNILFDHNGDVKITDFGLSKIIPQQHQQEIMATSLELTSQGAGTYWYLPPECFDLDTRGGPPRISPKVDVWSLGVILYEMLYGSKPFGQGQSQKTLLSERTINRNNRVNFNKEPRVSQQAKDFIEKCLTPSEIDRPFIHQLVDHPFVTGRTTPGTSVLTSKRK